MPPPPPLLLLLPAYEPQLFNHHPDLAAGGGVDLAGRLRGGGAKKADGGAPTPVSHDLQLQSPMDNP